MKVKTGTHIFHLSYIQKTINCRQHVTYYAFTYLLDFEFFSSECSDEWVQPEGWPTGAPNPIVYRSFENLTCVGLHEAVQVDGRVRSYS